MGFEWSEISAKMVKGFFANFVKSMKLYAKIVQAFLFGSVIK